MSKSSNKAKLAMAQSFANFMDDGNQSATVIIYEGTQPASPEVAPDSNNALVTLTFPEPCIKDVTATYIELYPTNTATVIKAGTTTWARIFNGAGEVAADLTVGTDITLANTNLALGGSFQINSFKIRP